LFTRISIPPNFFTASSTADATCFSSRISTTQGKHLPPAASTKIHVVHQYTRISHNLWNTDPLLSNLSNTSTNSSRDITFLFFCPLFITMYIQI
jgi:hypothetical protein